MKTKQAGFTLIEVLVVISIIALLSSIVLASISQARIKAENSHRNSMIIQYRNALELYASSNGGKYPNITPGTAVCLGTYTTWPGNKCGISINKSNHSSTLDNSLSNYISGFPPISNKEITLVLGSWLGATYQCLSPQCNMVDMKWYLQGDNLSCGPGILLNNNAGNTGATVCDLILGP